MAALVNYGSLAGNVHDRASRATLLDRVAALLGQPLLAPMDAEEASKMTALLVPGEAFEEYAAIEAGIFDRSDILGGKFSRKRHPTPLLFRGVELRIPTRPSKSGRSRLA